MGFFFAFSQDCTEREEAERRAPNTVEGRYLGLGTHRPEQADEEQEHKVTFQSCAVRVRHIALISLRLTKTGFFFACPQERTGRDEAERRDRAEEDRKKVEAGQRPKQADEEQQQKVTFLSCADRVFQFYACISR